jgi:predicted DNA-binding transcriptional regulator AlpA
MLKRDVPSPEISRALGISSSSYYRRKSQDSYPDAEELRLVAERFGLNPVDLWVRFGLTTILDVEQFLARASRGFPKHPQSSGV